MAIRNVMRNLPHRPTAFPIGSIKLFGCEASQSASHFCGKCSDLLDVPGSRFRAGICVWGKWTDGITRIGHNHLSAGLPIYHGRAPEFPALILNYMKKIKDLTRYSEEKN